VPNWIQYNKAAQTLYGIPTEIGFFLIRVFAKNICGAVSFQDFEIEVYSELPIINEQNNLQMQLDFLIEVNPIIIGEYFIF
jgi:hypothetical protein